MKQVLQSYKTGELKVADVPAPGVLNGSLLVRTTVSLVSAGTEKMVMDLAKKSLVGKAADRPDLVKKVADKLAKDGVVATAKAVMGKLDQPIPLGYSAAGVVLECGAGVKEPAPGQRVASAGAKVANHAELNVVPLNLCVPIPDNVTDEAASFVTLGAIALQGVRTANLTLGERVGVIGLGLIGQLTVQLLKANGCRVLGVDLDPLKVDLARKLGADAAVVRTDKTLDSAVAKLTDGRGLDAVIVCAATDSNDPVDLAGELSRDRGRVVIVGAVPMNVPRRPYYDKELSLLLSRSYGPGRYDPSYEEQGHDYPFGYVRWTEGRNLQAFLELCASGHVNVDPLITHRFDISKAEDAYALISGERREPFLGVLLTYPSAPRAERTIDVRPRRLNRGPSRPALSLVGSGNFALSVLAPELARREDISLHTVVSARGSSARHAAERFGFERCSTDDLATMKVPSCDGVIISTRHDLHASQAAAALAAGKAVFLEKPLAIDREGLAQVVAAAKASPRPLMVDFNRRFAPTVLAAKAFFENRGQPLSLLYRINAGPIPADSWIHDRAVGGGRIIGEVCHFIDLACFLAGSEVTRVTAESVADAKAPLRNDDQVAITLRHADGSLSSLLYTSGGDPSLPKERIELHAAGASGLIDDFKVFEGTRAGRTVRSRSLTKDKGHAGALDAFIRAVKSGGPSPMALRELAAVTLATFVAQEALGSGHTVDFTPELDALLGAQG